MSRKRAANPHWALEQLLQADGLPFVEQAYTLLFGRPADPAGAQYYLGLLQDGWSKWFVLGLLWRAEERLRHAPDVPGLQAGLARYALAQQHTLGGWYRRRVLGVDSDLPTDRHVRALAAGMRGARRVGPLADARPMAGSDGGSVAWQWAQDLPPGSNALAPAWAGREFAVAVSLGAFCHTAAVLRRLEMREGSGPLDWVFMNPAAVLHALQDGFRTFLDASHFEVVDAADKVDPHANVCEHRYYRQRFGVRYLFNHHNPTAPTDAAYFARCVQRFQAQMAAATAADGRGNDAVAPCLLVLMSYEPVAPAQVLAMRQALGAAAPGCFVLVLQLRVVRDVAAQLAGAYALADAGSHHAILNFCVRAPSDGLVFPYAEENDALAQLLNAFSVRRHKRHAPD